MKSNQIIGLAVGGFMAAASAVQAQPVPELYGRSGIPDDNAKINCVREAMYYFAGGNNGMIQSAFKDGATTTYQFETSSSEGETIGMVKVTGPRTDIDVYPIGSNVTQRQKTIYDYITSCDPRITPVQQP